MLYIVKCTVSANIEATETIEHKVINCKKTLQDGIE